jgi:hypothetical protein
MSGVKGVGPRPGGWGVQSRFGCVVRFVLV